jgi:hypothetical protein
MNIIFEKDNLTVFSRPTRSSLPKYFVYHRKRGMILEEFRHKAKAIRWTNENSATK